MVLQFWNDIPITKYVGSFINYYDHYYDYYSVAYKFRIRMVRALIILSIFFPNVFFVKPQTTLILAAIFRLNDFLKKIRENKLQCSGATR